jgi:hypothetical protein
LYSDISDEHEMIMIDVNNNDNLGIICL